MDSRPRKAGTLGLPRTALLVYALGSGRCSLRKEAKVVSSFFPQAETEPRPLGPHLRLQKLCTASSVYLWITPSNIAGGVGCAVRYNL
jgi:hypothetical protein